MKKIIINFIDNPYGLLIASLLILLIGCIVFKKRYLDCTSIIQNHLVCFKKQNRKYSKSSLFLYFGVPAMISISLVRIKNIDSDVINIVTIIISILTSMLFTMLTLVLDMRKRIMSDKEYNVNEAGISTKLLKETYYSIMYEILNSIIILIMCFIDIFSGKYFWLSSLVIYYLTFTLVMNLFMVLKRIFKVIGEDMKK